MSINTSLNYHPHQEAKLRIASEQSSESGRPASPTQGNIKVSTNQTFKERRALHDDKHMNYYDHLQRQAQQKRTKINCAPTVKKCTERGNIFHEPQPKTNRPINFHNINLNHSVIPSNKRF